MADLDKLKNQYESYKTRGLKLNMQRGQPGDENFALSNPMLTILDAQQTITDSGIELRNYPGGVLGLPEARQLFSWVLGVKPQEMIVGNNSSLKLLVNTLMWALIRGLKNSKKPWIEYKPPKMIVTVPGYDRHFRLLHELGFEMIAVNMTGQGPDIDRIEQLTQADASIKGLLFVPTYSNPTGDVVSDQIVHHLAAMQTAAQDFTIFADDAYAVHHLTEEYSRPLNLLKACEEAGNPGRVYIFGSTSKITFAGAGVGFMGCSEENVSYIANLMSSQFITPNKIEQYRHVKFLNQYQGGIAGIIRDHARLLAPKFKTVDNVLTQELSGTGLASWTTPKGGYFISLDTTKPVASRVVDLAKEAGVALTPAGVTFPHGKDPKNSNIRIAPTRPPVKEVELAMRIVALCIKIASME